ncbi:MAG: hypothetical protein QXF40_01145 [Metallosphaera sp.]
MVKEKDLEKMPLIIDEKPWIALLLAERKPILINQVRYKRIVKTIYEMEKSVRKRETRHGIILSLIMHLLSR